MKMSEIWYKKINEIDEMILNCQICKDGRIKQLQNKKAKLCTAYCTCMEAGK